MSVRDNIKCTKKSPSLGLGAVHIAATYHYDSLLYYYYSVWKGCQL